VPHRYPVIVVVVFSLLTVLLQRSLNALNDLSANRIDYGKYFVVLMACFSTSKPFLRRPLMPTD
jgi:hypothetical protein